MLAGIAVLASSAANAGTTTGKIRLSLNENSFGPSPRVRHAIEAELAHLNRYVNEDEANALATQIAALERVAPAQVVIGDVLGPLGVHLGLGRSGGGNVVYSTPGYTELTDAGAAVGVVGRGIALNAALENDLPALAGAIDAQTLAVSLVNPHNPSGTVNAVDAFDAFIRTASSRALVIVDEAYLEYDDAFERRTAVRLVREGLNVLVFRTLAKAYGLAGLPIGYAIAPAPLAAELRAAGISSPHTLDRLAVAAARAALGDQGHVQLVRQAIAVQRGRIHRTLDRLGWRHSDSQADFVFFAPPDPDRLRQRFAAAGIAIGRPFPPLDRWVRITVGTPRETDRVLAILA
ncbi:pyridoxal phosphate-dependent aminotransferase [Sphingomonas sp. GlSt437]|uniref:pyridoxal phosphate-dependent aminotransferase n=1 Tax=Sphingomonas sp. GlSt437 TaxID=3389970 RepID=UPI003EC09F0A